MDALIKLLILQQLTSAVLLETDVAVPYNSAQEENIQIKAISEKISHPNFELPSFSFLSTEVVENSTSNADKIVVSQDINYNKVPKSRFKRQLVGVHVHDPRQRNRYRGNPVHRSPYGGYEIKEIHNPHIIGHGYSPEIYIPQKERGHEIRDTHGGGSYRHESSSGGGYGHEEHGGGGRGYGQIDHGYKEPPKYIKAAPYYGPQYTAYDLIAPDKSKKNKKTKYGDDPIYEKGHYKDEPTSHFGGFGGGGSIGHKAKGGYKGSGGGHKGGGGGKGGYKGSGGQKGGGGGYKGSDEHKGGGGGYKGPDEHKGGGGGYGKSQSGYSTHNVHIEQHQPVHEHVSIPYNTYDAHADVRKVHDIVGGPVQHSVETDLNLNLNLRGANADVSDMLLYDPYALTDTKMEKLADIQLPNKVLNLKNV